ncbi:MAG TPA: rhomboid family intramembrane serine protease [Vicinamibacterales bacterium]|nr:rhomboid family intramembrane serine protease [Vicinamibacterales bacterium]
MIPLKDATRSPVRFPLVTVGLIAINVLAFIWELGNDDATIVRFAVVPAELMRGHGWTTPFTAMFLHAGFMHIIGNMLFLSAFAPVIEDTMGRGRFLVFYVLGGLAATAAQVVISPGSTVPQLGASGAIAAVMGAFVVTFPGDRIKVLWLLGWIVEVAYVPAVLLIGIWLLTQLMNQVGAVVSADTGGVAYAAHVGGALFGMLTARLFERGGDR